MNLIRDTEADKQDIEDVISWFMGAFDQKDYVLLQSILADRIYIDYSSFREEEAGIITSTEYVNRRRVALHHLVTEHLYSNLEINIENNKAIAKCNYHISRARRTKGETKSFNSEGSYIFTLTREIQNWLISGIVQKHLSSIGDHTIHGAEIYSSINNSN